MDDGVVADMIAAPEDDIIANLNKGLDGIVLKDEAVFADLGVVPDKGARADIGCEAVSPLFKLPVKARPHPVELG
jgi:hypothetical protein